MILTGLSDDTTSDGTPDVEDLVKFPLYVTQSKTDGSLSDFVSPENELPAFADFKRGLLDIVSYPAHKDALAGTLSADLEITFDYVDMHGPHIVKQTAKKHDTGVSLISTRVYQKAAEVPNLEAEAEAEEETQELMTQQSGTTEAELGKNGDTKEVKCAEEVKVLGATGQDQGEEGEYTESLDGVGRSDMVFGIDAKLVASAKKTGKCPEGTPAVAFLQTVAGPNPQRVAPYAPARPRAARQAEAFTSKDLKAAAALLRASEDFTSEVLKLSTILGREGAAEPVAKAGLKLYADSKDPFVFEKLAAALASSGRADGHAAAAQLAADESYPAQLRVKALVALTAAPKADESVLRIVESLANGQYAASDSGLPGDDDVPAAARLVLGGLLNKHRRAPSAYVKGLVAHMESAIAAGTLTAAQRVAYVASLGNAAYESSAAAVAPLASDSETREVRLSALHALRRLGLSAGAEAAVVAAARANDTSVSGEAVRLLQETGNVVALENLQTGVKDCAPFCPPEREGLGETALKNSVTVTFIEANQELSKSEVHYVKLTEGLYYKYGYDSSKSAHSHKVEGAAILKAGVYSVSWEFLKVGIYAEKVTGEKSGIYFFVDIMGLNVIKKTLAGGEPAVKSAADLQLGDAKYKNFQAGDRSELGTDLDDLLDEGTEEKGATCSGAWSAGIAGDFGYSRQLFKMSKSFWVYIIMLDVSFSGTGRVGLKPGLSVKTCTNARTSSDEVMVMGGMEPYASVTINLECSINLLLVRGGVGGELKVIDIGFPLYGEKYWSSGDLCGYLDFRYEACSGRLYLFADHISCSWFLKCGWKRFGEINIVTWTGWKGTKSILKACSAGNVGYQTYTSAHANCQRANWWGSFDRKGWSTCQGGKVMKGMYRNSCDQLYCLEEAECCNMHGANNDCYNANWWSSFDKQGWSSCNAGYYLAGFYRNSCNELYCLEEAKCCRGSKKAYKDCYEHTTMASTFDSKGWASCKSGYSMVGLWRNHGGCNRLYCIEKMKCCTS